MGMAIIVFQQDSPTRSSMLTLEAHSLICPVNVVTHQKGIIALMYISIFCLQHFLIRREQLAATGITWVLYYGIYFTSTQFDWWYTTLSVNFMFTCGFYNDRKITFGNKKSCSARSLQKALIRIWKKPFSLEWLSLTVEKRKKSNQFL